MKITEALKTELANWLDSYWTTYMKGDFDVWSTFIAEDYYNIGGTKEEIWHTKQEILDYSYRIHDQMVGQAEVRNREIEVLPYGDYVMVNEFTDLYVKIEGEWTYYGPFRMSSLLAKTNTGWIALHQHGSFPDMKTTEGEAFGSDALKAENKRLQEAVDQRTSELLLKNRELEIETSLEKVRTAAMGMTTPNDMLHVCRVIAQQLSIIGLDQIRNVQTAIIESQEEIYLCYQYFPSYDQEIVERTEYSKNPVEQQLVTQMLESKDSHFMGELAGKELHDFIRHRELENHLDDPLLEEIGELGYCFLSIGEGGLGLTLYKSLDEQSLTIFKRFHQVFSLAYQRFRDIQKAEAQAREAQIEAAVERVRAQSMAMHHPDDLDKVNKEILTQLNRLQVKGLTGVTFYLVDTNGWVKAWDFSSPGNIGNQTNYTFQFDSNKYEMLGFPFKTLENTNLDYFIADYPLEKLKKALPELEEIDPSIAVIFTKAIETGALSHQWSACARISNGMLGVDLTAPPSEDTKTIVSKMAGAFNQAYRRFLDLQKAEEQAKEAQIEAALERVRSKSLAMHQTGELQSVIHTVHEELLKLNLSIFGGSFIVINSEIDTEIECWGSGGTAETSDKVHIPRFEKPFYTNLIEGIKKGSGFCTEKYTNEEKIEFFTFLFKHKPWSNLSSKEKKETIKAKGGYTRSCVVSEHTSIFIINHAGIPFSDADNAILKRFGKVFEQSYTRFIDLQKAEAQAREAEIELALERVRARTMAMQHSEELLEVATLLFQQVKGLGVPQWNCGFNIWELGDKAFTYYPGTPDGVINPSPCKIPLNEHPVFRRFDDCRKKGIDLLVYEKEGEEQKDHYEYMLSIPGVGDLLKSMLEAGFELPTYQIDHLANFAYGNLIFITYEHFPEMHKVFKRFAKVFEQTYTRFLDLQKAEAQARESQIETALERVRSRSLAMHKSDEMLALIRVVSEQLRLLNIDFDHVSFAKNQQEGDFTFWTISKGQPEPMYLEVPTVDSPVLSRVYEAKKKGVDFLTDYYTAEENRDWSEHLIKHSELKSLPEQIKKFLLNAPGFHRSSFLLKNIDLYVGSYGSAPFTDQENAIFKRFALVFQQAYTRFLDLEKAEEQAQEAQIEAALERIRSRSLAMHNSSELSSVVDTLLQEFTKLEFTLTFCIINLIDGEDLSNTVWAANPETGKDPESYYMKFEDYDFHRAMWNAWKAQDKRFVYTLEGEEKKIYDAYLYSETEFRRFPKHVQEANKALDRYVAGFTFFKYSGLQTVSENEITEADLKILERFGKVFEQSYTRFIDLQKAEAQAREAEIELALERVRARTMAMQKSDELAEVSSLLFQQMKELGVTTYSSGFTIWDEDKDKLISWVCNADGSLNPPFYLPMTEEPWHLEQYESWKKGEDFIVKDLAGEDWKAYFRYLRSFPLLDKAFATSETAGHPIPVRQVHHAANFSYGNLLFITLEPRPEAHEIFKRFAKVFDQTYTRFLDLQKAEAQAREAKIEAALEKVRSRTMAMQRSEDLNKAASDMFAEIQSLGMQPWGCGFNIFDKDERAVTQYMSLADGGISPPYRTPLTEDPFFKSIYDARQRKQQLLVMESKGKELANTYRYMFSLPGSGEIFGDLETSGFEMPKFQITHCAYFSQGYLVFITYDHVPDAHDLFRRFAKVFDQTYTRFLDLQKAEAQAREAQINLAVERVRARALAMFKSEEILEVVVKLKEEIMGLDIPGVAAAAILLKEKNGMFRSWDLTSLELNGESMHTPLDVPFEMEKTHPDFYLRKVWEKGTNYTVVVQDTKSLQITCDWLRENNKVKEAEEAEEFLKSSGLQRGYHPTVPLNNGRMILDLLDPPEDEIEFILNKMGGAFDLAYKRFEDLEKAEAQTREARIEAALEKIRARTMGMQHSDELPEAAHLLFTEVRNLGIPAWSCGYNVLAEDNKSSTCWMSSENEIQVPFTLPLTEHESLLPWYEAVKKGDELFVYNQGGEDLVEHYRYLTDLPELKPVFAQFEAAGISLPTYQVNHLAKFNQGFLLFITYEKVPEAHEVFKRFAKVFNQTYTRFLDLQKAETQAKEAQIELSLERIRAQVTAMRESEDLLEIVVNMRKEFVNLGHEAHYFWHMRWLPETYDKAMTSGDGTQIGMVMSLPRHIHGDIPAVAAWEKGNELTHILAMDVDLAVDYVDKMVKLGDFERIDPQAPTLDDIRHIGGLTFVMARTTHGEIGYSLPGKVEQPPQESIETLARFAGVFDLAYRRFEDLLTAEKQNRKAKIELALERVRARAMAMQHPEELIQVANVMREEMGNLGVEELETSSIYINDSDTGLAECWYSILDVREGAKKNIADHFNLDYRDTWVGRQMFDFYQGNETNISILMKGENRKEWINYCARQSPKLNGYYGIEIPERTYHLTKFSNGAIGAATPGEISHESWDLLQRAATVFSLAYSRFKDLSQAREDLKKLKQAKAKAEKALKELKSAQEQLVQQEKLASLGQLTAGIAHEIKNPLNFVNNFSDLSRELIEEVFEELENLEDSSTKAEILAILGDVKNNLFKVHEHGTRANGIVSSMLQHSRASGNKREPKSFNPLVKEFTNLSFHGMRAAKEPINVDIELKLDPKVGEVSLISEDFSRVILNLCNNAFDAMRDKLKRQNGSQDAEAEVYLPKLTVTTALQKDKVILSIADNGLGIPKEIQDKILQPFFTTKKGTEGTGLGLSITNDIIKAHGGQLDIQSQPGSTIFKIQLTL